MSLNHLKKLKIVEGDDMSPAIDPKKYLLLDEKAKPCAGDVAVFINRFGVKIAHRIIYSFGDYFFLRGDNCNYFDFPCEKNKILGVAIGKHKDVKTNPVANFLLILFLLYYKAYKRLFDIKNKKHFLLLNMISKLYNPVSKIQVAK
jgi:hypothetical protein